MLTPFFNRLLYSKVVPNGCIRCQGIVEMEARLDEMVRQVVNWVLADVRPVREENNRRWEQFARICRIPVVGNWYFKIFNAPKLLDEPLYYEHFRYLEARRDIEPLAWELEELKGADMEHWGHEPVQTNDGMIHDPDPGYTRRQCYENGHTPFLPDKYDFNSAAGAGKFQEGMMVMCSVTKRLFPINQCAISTSGGKVFYYIHGRCPQTPGWFGFARV